MRLEVERAKEEKRAALNDTSWLKCDVKTWLTERGEGDLVNAFEEMQINTVQELVRNCTQRSPLFTCDICIGEVGNGYSGTQRPFGIHPR